jgi:hypothetical protein
MKAIVFAVGMALGLASCGAAGYKLTMTGASAPTAKPAGCEYSIFTTRPDRPYEEIAILDPEISTRAPSNVGEFKEKAGLLVCQAGGDGVITEINNVGMYTAAP